MGADMRAGVDVADGHIVLARRRTNPTPARTIRPSCPPILGRAGVRCCPSRLSRAVTAESVTMRPLLTHV
jgi:hypothetical protein